jgi:hypothetical protein
MGSSTHAAKKQTHIPPTERDTMGTENADEKISGILQDPKLLEQVNQQYKRYQIDLGPNFGGQDFRDFLHHAGIEEGSKKVVSKLKNTLREPMYRAYFVDPELKIDKWVLVGGGPGAGKSTVLSNHPLGKEYTGNKRMLLYDSSLGKDIGEERSRIQEVLDKDIPVQIDIVYRPIEHAAKSIVHRAESTGRKRPINAAKHFDVIENFLNLQEEFKSNKQVSFGVFCNTGSVSDIKYLEGDTARDFLTAHRYESMDAAEKRANMALEGFYEERLQEGKPVPSEIIEKTSGIETAKAFDEKRLIAEAERFQQETGGRSKAIVQPSLQELQEKELRLGEENEKDPERREIWERFCSSNPETQLRVLRDFEGGSIENNELTRISPELVALRKQVLMRELSHSPQGLTGPQPERRAEHLRKLQQINPDFKEQSGIVAGVGNYGTIALTTKRDTFCVIDTTRFPDHVFEKGQRVSLKINSHNQGNVEIQTPQQEHVLAFGK